MQTRIVLVLIGVVLLGAGCGGSEDARSEPTVVAAFYPLAYAAERVAPTAEVRSLTPAGTEPHDLELSARDVEVVRSAEHVLYLGRGFMPALEDAVHGARNAVDLLTGASLLKGTGGSVDPHLWLDPLRYARLVERVAEAFGDPGGAGELVAELERLDRELRAGLRTCARRELVVSHAAFGYLAAAYDLEQIPLTGLSPEVEPSARAIEGLVREVEESGATTVFFETLVSPRLAQTVAREAGARTAVLDPLEGLSEDELADGGDYFSVMRDNLSALRRGLGCT